MKRPCGIYEVKNKSGRISYKIFADGEDKDKTCDIAPVFTAGEYKEYPNTQVRKLSSDEIKRYMSER